MLISEGFINESLQGQYKHYRKLFVDKIRESEKNNITVSNNLN